MKPQYYFSLLFLLVLMACKPQQNTVANGKDDGIITFTFIQLNDVYEIAPLSGGKYGGLARVAYVRDSIQRQNPNTFLLMAGDFLNPSLLGTIKYEGERIQGKQMIEVMNAMDFDLVTFGNHEFDIGEASLQKRLNESQFPWTSANVRHVLAGDTIPFVYWRDGAAVPVGDTQLFKLSDSDGTKITLGFFSVTLDSNPQEFVSYGDVLSEAKRAYQDLEPITDLVFGLTHVTLEQDKELARQLPKVPLFMGGHEHNSMQVSTQNGTIVKADANAKTVYVHTLTYSTQTKKLQIDSKLLPIDERTPSKPEVAAIVAKWDKILQQSVSEVIDNPNEVIYMAYPPLDGTDSASRGVQTNLGAIITHAMALSFTHDVDGALVNGGSIRLDDMLAGEVTSLDIFRVLPFGGNVVKVQMEGALLLKVLDYGKASGGTGAYLQRYNIAESSTGGWLLGGEAIDEDENYTIAFSDFLLKGYDIPFLTPKHPGVLEVYEPMESEAASDIRKAVILYLKSKKQQP
ncbi:bifunctional metallophosphatase/5'-nucleotidase [Altibacter lentus]|uniref:bifunctional metallophosphatase/5'-nucleotidase n=1 Tax=Altibacter lentus TaxID=1223410 RepID=UPI000553A9F9|nr:bifunctional metallophosphatase/5'-nucleotidase [Altibacter lentus]